MLGGSEFRLRQGFALRAKRLYGAKRRPICDGAPEAAPTAAKKERAGLFDSPALLVFG